MCSSDLLPYETLIPITVIYVAIFLSGVFGNVTTMLVILTNQYMHSATNYYLFNLAVADMTTLIMGECHSLTAATRTTNREPLIVTLS